MGEAEPRCPSRARYIMIGGFLGAGKTTAVARLARHLTDQGVRVGLITNDQSIGLVDTALLRSQGFAVEEITGGCFCCRFPSLKDAADQLTARNRPDVFVAEPVGSCTDLVATVSYPLRRMYGDQFIVAPLSVMVDPIRAARILGLAEGRSFSPKVTYVYRKQLEEAKVIVVNKCDDVDEELRNRLVAALREQFPRARVMCVSAKESTGLAPWFDLIMAEEDQQDPTMEIDYDLYAEGEALLGWLNATLRVEVEGSVDGNEVLLEMARAFRDRAQALGVPIAHLKMTLDGDTEAGGISVVSLVRNDAEPDLRESLLGEVTGGHLIVNLRAEAEPDDLLHFLTDVLARTSRERIGLQFVLEHEEHFRPARPTPTHRLTVSG